MRKYIYSTLVMMALLLGGAQMASAQSTSWMNSDNVKTTVAPNPTSGAFSVNVGDEFEGDVLVRLYDLTGKQITTKRVQKVAGEQLNLRMDISNYANGVYFVEVRDDKAHLNRRLVKKN